MSADPIVYCLENLTDYPQFERLCSDVMNESGYVGIEPLGGSKDRGRDALFRTTSGTECATIFAYSVRTDWEKKLLKEDCVRIQDEKHNLSKLVFVTTASLTASQKDAIKEQVLAKFGWELEIHDLERLRIRLATDLRYLIARHPAIFCPPFFPSRGGLSIARSRDTLIVDHHEDDHALATWLARRLLIEGFKVWCYGTAPLAGDNADESIRVLIEARALKYLPVLSASSVQDADFVARCSTAMATDELLLPCKATHFDAVGIPTKLRALIACDFSKSWSSGLMSAVEALNAAGTKRHLEEGQGTAIALRSYVPEPVTKNTPEDVFANTFHTIVPDGIFVCTLSAPLTKVEKDQLRTAWAFVEADADTYLAFEKPPKSVRLVRTKAVPQYAWRHHPFKHNKRSRDVVKELVQRSLDVACLRAGLQWCPDRKKHYFSCDDKPQLNLSYKHVDGRKTRVAATGEKSYGSGSLAVPFRYQLCPVFRVGQDELGEWWVTMRIYIRITDTKGNLYEKKAIARRRKIVAKSWWNKEWFARTLAIAQFIAQGDKEIVIGTGSQAIRVSVAPLTWSCPVSIDYVAVERIGDFQQEMAELRFREDEETETEELEEVPGSER